MYRAGQTQGQGQQQGQLSRRATDQQGQGSPSISQGFPLPLPLEAMIDATGETVTLLQTCDWPGHSPSNIGVDKYGKQFVASFQEVTVTDHRVVPNAQATAIRARNLQQSGQSQRTQQ